MKNTVLIATITLLICLYSCGKNTVLTPVEDDSTSISFGTDSTLDIVTWNLKLFPENSTNIDALTEMIPALNADVIAFQEIMDADAFYSLAASIPYYTAYIYDATSEYRLAYLVDTRTITVNNSSTIYNGYSNPFPRPPYVLDITWNNQNYYVINNHFKAYGDNVIDEDDEWDEEMRRRLACQMLDEYISTNLSDDRVIVLGDMNDQLAEPVEYNVFLSFLNKPEEYLFADMPIAQNTTFQNASYPGSTSQIDHILITNELFSAFTAADNYCITIKAENMVGSLPAYTSTISDHRPVGIRLGQ